MTALIFFAVLGIWSAIWYNLGYWLCASIQRKWLRKLAGIAAVFGVTTLVLSDEILGAIEFKQLCQSARTFQISPEAEGKKFEVLFSRTDDQLLPNTWRPTWQYLSTYKDAATSMTIATGNGYKTEGGWLIKRLGMNPLDGGSRNALFGTSYCYPSRHGDEVKKLRSIININVK